MDPLMNEILTIDKVSRAPQRILECSPGIRGLNQVYGPSA